MVFSPLYQPVQAKLPIMKGPLGRSQTDDRGRPRGDEKFPGKQGGRKVSWRLEARAEDQ